MYINDIAPIRAQRYKIKQIFPKLFYARLKGVSLPFINVTKRVTSFGNPYSHCSTTPKSCDLHVLQPARVTTYLRRLIT